MMRIERVWLGKIAEGSRIGEEVRRAVKVARAE
jgi:hypothetical protein